jgi:hypothetical protein
VNLPQLGLLAGYGDTAGSLPLVIALRPWCRPAAPDPALGPPDAYFATDPGAPGLPAALTGPAPVAVVIPEAGRVPSEVLEHADVLVTTDRTAGDLLGERAVVVGADLVAADAHPPISPFVRTRWRSRLGLPDAWFVHIGTPEVWPGPETAIPGALAVCSAASVRGPWLTTALALGTPTVTDAGSARRLGAEPNVHCVVSSTVGIDPALERLAADPARATAISIGGRRLVEERHDLGTVARDLLDRLGIPMPALPGAPLADLDAELTALGTPAGSPVTIRALQRAAGVAGPASWESLTGRRR